MKTCLINRYKKFHQESLKFPFPNRQFHPSVFLPPHPCSQERDASMQQVNSQIHLSLISILGNIDKIPVLQEIVAGSATIEMTLPAVDIIAA